jgi:hypothetical protein
MERIIFPRQQAIVSDEVGFVFAVLSDGNIGQPGPDGAAAPPAVALRDVGGGHWSV